MKTSRALLLAGLLGLVALASPSAQSSAPVSRLDLAIRGAGVAIDGVWWNGTAWKVWPVGLQAAAQPTIDAFNQNDLAAELNKIVTGSLDNERLYSAIVWTIIDTYSPPATMAKYNVARTKIINAYASQPWKP